MKHLKPMSARTSNNHPPMKSNLNAKGSNPSFLPSDNTYCRNVVCM